MLRSSDTTGFRVVNLEILIPASNPPSPPDRDVVDGWPPGLPIPGALGQGDCGFGSFWAGDGAARTVLKIGWTCC